MAAARRSITNERIEKVIRSTKENEVRTNTQESADALAARIDG
jgi:hypothetical protein